MRFFGLTDKGAVRADNQDSFIIEKCGGDEYTAAVLCDGMGGAKAGELASALCSREFMSHVTEKLSSKSRKKAEPAQLLRDACKNANGLAFEYSRFDEAYEGMGTTLVGGVIRNSGKGYIINVGDSRAYKLSLKSGTITQITKDHSLVQLLTESRKR